MRIVDFIPNRQSLLLGSILLMLTRVVSTADLIIEHLGSTDPLTEGFDKITSFGEASTVEALANDLGSPALSITGSTRKAQYGYALSSFTAGQLADIAATGFTMTPEPRALQNIAPAYDNVDHVVTAGSLAAYEGETI